MRENFANGVAFLEIVGGSEATSLKRCSTSEISEKKTIRIEVTVTSIQSISQTIGLSYPCSIKITFMMSKYQRINFIRIIAMIYFIIEEDTWKPHHDCGNVTKYKMPGQDRLHYKYFIGFC